MTTLRRQVKNVIKNYTEAEVKVREATSNDPWGPSSTLMSEISDLTYNIVALGDIMRMIWKRLNDHGKNWRHVYKSLVLLDYLIKNGNEKVAQQCKEHIVAIQTLKDFQYIEENKDQGANVRDKAKQLVALLRDDERLKQERMKALKARERYAQNAMGISSDNKITYGTSAKMQHTGTSVKSGGNYTDPYGGASRGDNEYTSNTNGRTSQNGVPLAPDLEAVRPSDANEEELQVNLAMMLSKQEHEEELQRKRADDAKLQLAIEQSRIDNSTGSQDNGLLDLASGFATSVTTNDPWSDNFINVNTNNTINSDPWVVQTSTSSSSNKQQQQLQIADPWSNNSINNNNNNNNINLNKQLNDPWSSSSSNTSTTNKLTTTNPWSGLSETTTTSNDPWNTPITSSTTTITKKEQNNDFDEFELFTNNRVTSPTNLNINKTNNTNNDPFVDFFGTNESSTTVASTNPWGDNNNKTEQLKTAKPANVNPIRKTPESFLGENSSLVNLDNLIPTTTTTTTTNTINNSSSYNQNLNNRPKSTNPFGGVQQQLSTLQQSSSANNLLNRQSSTNNSSIINTNNNNNNQNSVINPFLQQAQKPPTINQLNGNSANLFPSFNTTSTTPMPFIQPILPTTTQSPIFMNNNNNPYPLNPAFNTNTLLTNQLTATTTAFSLSQQSTNPFL